MKIIKNEFINRTAKIKCTFCKSLLEVAPSDLKRADSEYDDFEVWSADCPCCLKTFTVKPNPFS